jgi:hypothetical protein
MNDDSSSSRGHSAVAESDPDARSAYPPYLSEAVEKKFLALVLLWKQTQGPQSSVPAMVMHPAYQRIVGLGPPAVPLLLRELERRPDHWFWALNAITGEDPVAAGDRGNLTRMTEAWLGWGRRHGFI